MRLTACQCTLLHRLQRQSAQTHVSEKVILFHSRKKICDANHPKVLQLFVINIAESDFCCLDGIQIKMSCVRRSAVDNLLPYLCGKSAKQRARHEFSSYVSEMVKKQWIKIFQIIWSAAILLYAVGFEYRQRDKYSADAAHWESLKNMIYRNSRA